MDRLKSTTGFIIQECW